ncbi:type II secretion system protein N, partial [Marilutibacter aestuarii]
MIHALPTLDDDSRRRLLRQACVAVEVALVAMLAFQAARLAWMLIVPPAPVGATAGLAREAAPAPGFVDAFHPGSPSTSPGADERMTGFAVHGLRMDPRPGGANGAAIIAGPDKTQHAYRVGDVVADGIVLARVEPGYAVLRRGGREVPLALVAGPQPSSPAGGGR